MKLIKYLPALFLSLFILPTQTEASNQVREWAHDEALVRRNIELGVYETELNGLRAFVKAGERLRDAYLYGSTHRIGSFGGGSPVDIGGIIPADGSNPCVIFNEFFALGDAGLKFVPEDIPAGLEPKLTAELTDYAIAADELTKQFIAWSITENCGAVNNKCCELSDKDDESDKCDTRTNHNCTLVGVGIQGCTKASDHCPK